MGAPRGEMALLLCSAPLTPASLHSVLLETHDTALSPAKSPVRDWKKAYFFFFLAMLRGLWDLSYPTRD